MQMRVMSGAAVVIITLLLTAAREAAAGDEAKTLELAEIVAIVESVAGPAQVRDTSTSVPTIDAWTDDIKWFGYYWRCGNDDEPDCTKSLS